MAGFKEITMEHDYVSSVILNVTNQEVHLTPDVALKSGEYQMVRSEEEKEDCEPLFHIIHPFMESTIAVTLFTIPLREPPIGETYFQFLHLNPSKHPVIVKARFGDVLHKSLDYKSAIGPILLYTPMDVPIDINQSKELNTVSLEGYVTRPNVYTIGIYVEDEAVPYWIVHIKGARSDC
ncbi:hypothetical protein N780_00530 [Pontibacillus chungwhensis BH030062]|uniref:Uncharacterized protein n=1 Tax=Pontibacillus chungwhensis BH030062 TaxID=1385513 RepID=A0A0A2V040_9BACI|nr:hypothetical protein [Pontibacillus chungwhensis]KGP92348.1 hypothetical protein N780_00530 [Pontibacillus chungwhensis BH030062]